MQPQFIIENSELIHISNIPKDITHLELPNCITKICRHAFSECHRIQSVSIPDSVTHIDDSVFEFCFHLTSVTLPNKITSIPARCFAGCSSLRKVTLPEHITKIESSAFRNCRSLVDIRIPDSVISIGDNAFACCASLSSFNLPSQLQYIGDLAFAHCDALQELIIPNSVVKLGENVVGHCASLHSLTLPQNISVNYRIMPNCPNLTTIYNIPKEHPFMYSRNIELLAFTKNIPLVYLSLDYDISLSIQQKYNILLAMQDNHMPFTNYLIRQMYQCAHSPFFRPDQISSLWTQQDGLFHPQVNQMLLQQKQQSFTKAM